MTIPFLNVTPKSVKLKVSPRFPAQLLGGIGTSVVKANGNYTINLAYSDFPLSPSMPNTPNVSALVYDTVLQQYTLVPADLFVGVSEAPEDGFFYGRNTAVWQRVLGLAGGTMTGVLNLAADPTSNLQAATKHYVDATVVAGGGYVDAPSDGYNYGRLNGNWNHVAPLTSPGLLGTPTSTTPAANDNSTNIATTAYVQGQASATTPAMDGTAAIGTSAHWARADHVHPTDTSRAAAPAGTSILKGNSGSATLANAVAGTDYLAPPAGTAIQKANSGGALANAVAGTDFVSPSVTATFTVGYNFTAYSAGTFSGTFTPAPANGNYQYGTNNAAFTLAAPTVDCAIDLLITNGASAGAITFTGFTVGSNTGDALTTVNTSKFLISMRRINAIATYVIKALQ